MLSEPSTILSSELNPNDSNNSWKPDKPRTSFKTSLLVISLIIVVVILILAGYFVFQKYKNKPVNNVVKNNQVAPSASPAMSTSWLGNSLPNFDIVATSSASSSNSFSSSTVEYLSFATFYKKPDNSLTPSINDYSLPLNVKMDVLNYFDLSRKLNLDPGLDTLNNNGFALIDNPWSKEAPDFISIYESLKNHQIPIVITSDFAIYQYQNILKKAFKSIEENVFYDNLWEINMKMYNAAKDRYEARLAAVGKINDPILEGERLEAVFFAVALELLKPTLAQSQPAKNTVTFTKSEIDYFYFVTPTYLRDDVDIELKLIRAASPTISKSPVLLYKRSYADFAVPTDYKNKPKLNNFYLATRWLNSLFPLNPQGPDCPNCLLDSNDWRISFTAASLIAHDFSNLPLLKSKWARIYKVMSYFKGLHDDLSYLYYRDSLISLFGVNYQIDELFSDQNKNVLTNLDKFRAKLLSYEFQEIFGATAKGNPNFKQQQGFRVLAESYSPNSYIFNNLLYPTVGAYSGTSSKPEIISACKDKKMGYIRCLGTGLDVVNLVSPVKDNNYFLENSNYANYNQMAASLQENISKNDVWHMNNYWTTLKLMKSYLEMNKNNLPVFAGFPAWSDKMLKTAVSTWVNFQLPADQVILVPSGGGASLGSVNNDNSYVEPNLDLINELLANNDMLVKMFLSLQLNVEVRSSIQDLMNLSNSLESLKKIILKELSGQDLDNKDNETVSAFVRQLKVTEFGSKQLYLRLSSQGLPLKEDLSNFKLLVLTHQSGDKKIFSVGPVWNYKETNR